MTVALLSHPDCLLHEAGAGHPERPERLAAVRAGLSAAGLDGELLELDAPLADRAQLERVHTAGYVEDLLRRTPRQGLVRLDPDTTLGPHTIRAARRAAGAAVRAVELVLDGTVPAAFCNVRPPGHHAGPARAMGFCFFDNVAVGAAHALASGGLARVAIADFDVHHGNGTEEIFAGDPRVLLCSSFQAGLFPDSGARSAAPNLVATPLPSGTGSDGFREAVERDWLRRLAAFRPELLLVSAGFDGHAAERLADLELRADDYAWVTRRLREAVGPGVGVVSCLEGGYELDALGRSAAAHVGALAEG